MSTRCTRAVIAFRLRTRTLFRHPGGATESTEVTGNRVYASWRATDTRGGDILPRRRRSLIACQRRSGDREQRARVLPSMQMETEKLIHSRGETVYSYNPDSQLTGVVIPKRVVKYFLVSYCCCK